jgi:hypothetical protein
MCGRQGGGAGRDPGGLRFSGPDGLETKVRRTRNEG